MGFFALLASSFVMFFIKLESFNQYGLFFAGCVHLFLLGFVMMIVLGSLTQLLPVVLHSPHFMVKAYAYIAIFTGLGALLLILGFFFNSFFMAPGAVFLILGLGLYLLESTISICKNFEASFTRISLLLANASLLIGLYFGLCLALNLLGLNEYDFEDLLANHVAFILGFFYIIILCISLVLLPMFWISHKLKFTAAKISLALFVFALILRNFHYSYIYFIAASLACFLYQIYVIHLKRVRKARDLYYKESLGSIFFLVLSIIFVSIFLQNHSQSMLFLTLFSFGWGFLGFLIFANTYKILPFLVWYKVYSPLVGKQSVPSFVQMVPKSSEYNFYLNLFGVIFALIGIFLTLDWLYLLGCLLVLLGVCVLLKNVYFIITLKPEHKF